MVISNITSCLNSSPPTASTLPGLTPSSSTQPSTTQLPWSWSKSSAASGAAVACVIVASAVGLSGESYGAELVQEVEVGNVRYWSQRKACPAWRVNSLESIVPENLPRPFSTRRRTEVAGVDLVAPAIGVSSTSQTISSCFSL